MLLFLFVLFLTNPNLYYFWPSDHCLTVFIHIYIFNLV